MASSLTKPITSSPPSATTTAVYLSATAARYRSSTTCS
uniref:Uncharacterized protein n=1 Tax=Arundo donax TaxID=35708 RepID=A0A0A9H8T7_ARUDO